MAMNLQQSGAAPVLEVEQPRGLKVIDPTTAISLIIPVKNEAGGIKMLVESCRPFADEIIVVDGHSTDNTVELATEAGADQVILDDKSGKGGAYRIGANAARFPYVVFIDGDGSHDPADIPRLVAPLRSGKADMVVGSRIRGGSDELHGDLDNFLRAMGSGIITTVINLRWKSEITDALNGYRAVRKDVFQRLDLRCTDFDIEQHMICQCLRKGFRLQEVPSHEYVRKWGSSKLPTFRKGYLFLWRLFLDLL